jgi:hypothetical protein
MASEEPTENTDRSRIAFRNLMFRMAAHDSEKLDARTVLSLHQCGLLQKLKATPLPADTAAIISDPDHARRVAAPMGPFIFVKETNTTRSVLDLVDYLTSSHQDVRNAVVNHFRRFSEGETITSRTLLFLADNSPQLVSADSDIWQPAAVKAYDAVRSDYLCNLAGLRQCLLLQFDEGTLAALQRALHPSGESMLALNIPVGDAGEQREEIVRAVVSLANSGKPLVELLDDYFARFGHLPLSQAISIAAVVATRVQPSTDLKSLWAELWDWANRHDSALCRYHVCQFYCSNPAAIPSDFLSLLWDEIASIVDASSESDSGRWSEAWRVRCGLARHFDHYCSYTFQGHTGDRLAGISWWLAERVTITLGSSPDLLKHIRERIVLPEVELSSYVWQLVHPPSKPSRLAYATTLTRSVWSVAILSQMEPLIRHFGTSDVTPPSHAKLQAALNAGVLSIFPWNPVQPGLEVYAFDSTVTPAAQAWITASGPGEGRDLLNALMTASQKLRETEDFAEQLAKSIDNGQADQFLVAGAFRAWAYQHEGDFEKLWETISTPEWGDKIFLKAETRTIELVFEALNEIRSRGDEKWTSYLPHLFASYCQRIDDEQERKALLFAFTMFSSLSSNGLSAIDRLARSRTKSEYSQLIDQWRASLCDIQPNVPEWVKGRIGAALVALRIAPSTDNALVDQGMSTSVH